MRGNRTMATRRSASPGSIPARAGEPVRRSRSVSAAWVYPRACGGTEHEGDVPRVGGGLSPRVRGNRRSRLRGQWSTRSIPARAGEPLSPATCCIAARVYPRVCGGTGHPPDAQLQAGGLSPRVHGNHALIQFAASGRRSIPARAGEPRWTPGTGSLTAVYPRACGGTTPQ